MKNIRDSCIGFFKNEEICRDIREMLRPLVTIVYNELYLYIWAICLFNVPSQNVAFAYNEIHVQNLDISKKYEPRTRKARTNLRNEDYKD